MRRARLLATMLVAAPLAASAATADERVEHYAAKPSETIEAAVKNFSEYNKRLVAILEKDKLTQADMEKVHELTYTLEVALAKINEEMSSIVPTLEEVHLSSEEYNEAKLRGVAEVYLEVARTVVK